MFLVMDSKDNIDEQLYFAMKAGDGPLSYFGNSSYQSGVLEAAKLVIEEEIATKLEISSNQNSFCIADFGCSIGNNSFPAMQMIVDAVKRKHESSGVKVPEFHVSFNDVVGNDFNTLFASLPRDRCYTAAAVAGDFHRRLLPPSSVNFAYSSWSLHWLTEVPRAVTDGGSPAWNGGEIFYTRERKEVCDAYLDQFGREVESFLNARAVEMVDGGLTAVIIPGVPAVWDPEKEYTLATVVEPLRSSLVDIAKKGRFSETKIDSFNVPHLFPTLEQFKAILGRTKHFTIENMKIIENKGRYTFPNISGRVASFRAVFESMVAHHFGGEIIDELFDQYEKKLTASPIFNDVNNDKTIMIFVVLKKRTGINVHMAG